MLERDMVTGPSAPCLDPKLETIFNQEALGVGTDKLLSEGLEMSFCEDGCDNCDACYGCYGCY